MLLHAARTADPLLQKLLVVAAITKALDADGIRPVIVGGTAVAFYTAGGYSTEDVDLAVVGRERFAEVIEGLGFKRQGRFWTHPSFAFPVEAPASALAGEDAPLTEVMVDGCPVLILGIEDLIVDRLNAHVHWRSEADGDWVQHLLAARDSAINWQYLRTKAAEHGTLDALNALAAK